MKDQVTVVQADAGGSCGQPGADYGSEGWGFDSLRVHHESPVQRLTDW